MSDADKQKRVEDFLLKALTKMRPQVERIVDGAWSGHMEVHHNRGEFSRVIARQEL